MKTALFSVFHKKGADNFARVLADLGWHILASGGTAKYLCEAGIPVNDVADFVGGQAILGHRVVTLSREVHAALLSRDTPEDVEEMRRLGLPCIDLVCCDFYPLAAAIAEPNANLESVVDMTDIGGPTMVRSAAKGGRIVVCDPADRELVIGQLQGAGDVNAETRQYLRAKAEAAVAAYTLDSARFHSHGNFDGMTGWGVQELAYGENRDQSPAFLHAVGGNDPLGWDKFQFVSGSPGYINMADGEQALSIMCLMAEAFRRNFDAKMPHIAIACKHGNPCGASVDWNNPIIALHKALSGDPIAVMGAEVMTSFPIIGDIGRALYEVPSRLREQVGRKYWGVDVVFAPRFNDAAIELLGKRENRRLAANPQLQWPTMPKNEWVLRPVRGGFLRQKAPTFIFHLYNTVEMRVGAPLSSEQLSTLILAWAVAWRASSNTVILAKDNMLIGPGVGQQDRVACCQLALDRAKRADHDTRGAFFASDAFFPYARRKREEDPLEGPELLAEAGCIGGVVPADGKNLQEVRSFFAERNMQVAFVAKEHRGFSRH